MEHTKSNDAEIKTPLIITCSSDRGLCGGIHSSVAKQTKRILKKKEEGRVAVLGIKARSKLQYDHAKQIACSFDGVCKFPPTWLEASSVAEVVLALKQPNDGFNVIYNSFKSVISFDTVTVKIPTLKTITESRKLSIYYSNSGFV